jgi:hypothetical protein
MRLGVAEGLRGQEGPVGQEFHLRAWTKPSTTVDGAVDDA